MRTTKRVWAAAAGASAVALVPFAASAQEPSVAPATARSAENYAKAYEVSREEAGQRLTRQRDIGELNAKLERDEAATFGGLYIDHKPSYRVVAKFTQNGTATLARYSQDPAIVADVAMVSYKQLIDTQTEVYRLLKALGIESASQVNVRTSKIEFFVVDPAAVQRLVTAGTLALPNTVTIGRAQRSLDKFGEAKVEGGRPLNTNVCTTGFTVVKSGTRYLTTAGHCGDVLSYNGVSLPFVGQNYRRDTSFDYQ